MAVHLRARDLRNAVDAIVRLDDAGLREDVDPPRNFIDFIDRVPLSAMQLPDSLFRRHGEHVLVHNDSEERCYDLMLDHTARDDEYTLYVCLARRQLGDYVYDLYVAGVRRISDIYDMHVCGKLLELVETFELLKLGDYKRFKMLGDAVVHLFWNFSADPFEFE